MFYKIRNKIPMLTMKNIYFATVHSKLLYGIEIYANTCTSYLDRLCILNNKLLRIAQNKNYDSATSTLYIDYNTLPIELLFKYKCLQLSHKISHHKHLLPNVFSTYFMANSDVHDHNTRSKNLIHMSQHNTNIGLRNFNYLGGHLWNSLPNDYREIISLNLFKKTVNIYLQKLI